MPLTRSEAENFTVFEDITIPFSGGLNVLVGENAMGKTNIDSREEEWHGKTGAGGKETHRSSGQKNRKISGKSN